MYLCALTEWPEERGRQHLISGVCPPLLFPFGLGTELPFCMAHTTSPASYSPSGQGHNALRKKTKKGVRGRLQDAKHRWLLLSWSLFFLLLPSFFFSFRYMFSVCPGVCGGLRLILGQFLITEFFEMGSLTGPGAYWFSWNGCLWSSRELYSLMGIYWPLLMQTTFRKTTADGVSRDYRCVPYCVPPHLAFYMDAGNRNLSPLCEYCTDWAISSTHVFVFSTLVKCLVFMLLYQKQDGGMCIGHFVIMLTDTYLCSGKQTCIDT